MYLKLTYILVGITLLASSCSTDTTDDLSLSKGDIMSFDVSDLTRGSVTTSISDFVVFGDTKSLAVENESPVVVFNNTKVEYKYGVWSYGAAQYWIPDNEHSFVAISPAGIFESDNSFQYSDSRLSFEYSIPVSEGMLSETGDVADILVTTYRRLYIKKETGKTNNYVTFKFSHLLSLINLSPAFYDNNLTSDDYILVHKLELTGVKTKASFSVMPAPRLSNSETEDMIIDVNSQQEDDIAIQFQSPVKIANNATNVNLFANNDAIIMLPQSFAADSDTAIILSYTISGGNTMNQVSLPLNSRNWESGKSYLYKFTIERTGTIFDSCEINPWNVIQGENITVD